VSARALRPAPRYGASDRAARPWLASFAALLALTAAGWVLGRAGLELTSGAPRDALPARPETLVELLAANVPVALWPLALVALGWPAMTGVRVAGDLLIAAQLLGHGLLVGAALATHPSLWRFLPHLPLEWAALAVPAGTWLAARLRPGRTDHRELMQAGLLTGALLIVAAAVETYAVPI